MQAREIKQQGCPGIYFYSEFMYKELSYRLGMVTMKMSDTG